MRHQSAVLERTSRAERAAGGSGVPDALPLRAAVDAAVDGIILMDTCGRLTLFNPACERMFGYPAAAVVGAEANKQESGYACEHRG